MTLLVEAGSLLIGLGVALGASRLALNALLTAIGSRLRP
jgi:hypothetical protein